MWTTEHSVETTAAPDAVWRAWTDVEGWPRWNADIDRIELRGPFAIGTVIAMTPRGQETVELRIADLGEGEFFVDEAEVDGTLVRTMHRIERLGGDRSRIVYRLEASGPAEEQIGPAVSADFDATLSALVRYAGR